MARGLKFCIQKVEGLYYLCSENKGADQLRGHRETDLRLCVRICKSQFSHNEAHICPCLHMSSHDIAKITGGASCLGLSGNFCCFYVVNLCGYLQR